MNQIVEDIFASLPSFPAAMQEIDRKAAEDHSKVFPKLRQELQGRDVALVASGPTVHLYEPIPNTIHVGINSAIYNTNVILDYFFTSDSSRAFHNAAMKYTNKNCHKFYGEHIDLCYCNSSKKFRENANAEKYYLDHLSTTSDTFLKDIVNHPITYSPSTVFCVIQILLWCLPKKIYLIGCDCSGGWYAGNSYYTSLVQDWQLLKNFREKYYSQVDIFSIHPVGLKGLFNDIYQNEQAVSALQALSSQKYTEALSAARSAYSNAPNNPGIKLLLLDCLSKNALQEEAEKTLRLWLDKAPDWIEGWHKRAQLAREQKDYLTAKKLALHAMEQAPENILLKNFYLELLYDEGQVNAINSFIANCQEKESVCTLFSDTLCAKADISANKGLINIAIKQRKEALHICPSNMSNISNLSGLLLQTGRYKEAENILKKGIISEPTWLDGYRRLAWLYKSNKQFEKAFIYIFHAIKLQPYSLSVWRQIPYILLSLKEYQKATKIAYQILEVIPECPDGLTCLAHIENAQHQTKKAIDLLYKAIKGVPEAESGYRQGIRYYLATLLFSQKKYIEALNIIEEHLKYNHIWREGATLKCKILASLKSQEAAIQYAKEILQIDPYNLSLVAQLASLLLSSLQEEAAMKLFRDTLSIIPEWAEGWYQLAKIYEKKNLTAALDCMAKVPPLAPENTSLRKYYVDLIYRRSKKAACAEYMNILRDNPRWGEGWRSVAMLYLERKNTRLAEQCVRRAARLLGKERWGLVVQCKVYTAARNYPAACQAVMTLIREHQHWPYSWREYALFHETFGRYLLALDAAHKASILGKDDAKVADVCRQIVRRAQQKFSGDKAVLLKCAKVHEELREIQEATRFVRQALALAPKSLPALRQLRRLFKKDKRWGAYLWLSLKISGIRMMRKIK